jgi:hypothetical protein
MIRYNNKEYPQNIACEINEISGHFGKTAITQKKRYSLHTEYSFEKRTLNNILLDDLSEIKQAIKKGIPQLWRNKAWARDFFIFIERLLHDSVEPEIIEIHPPFVDYCLKIDDFLEIYKVFEQLVFKKYCNVKIFIENRYGTHNSKKFLISTCRDIINLCEKLDRKDNKLQIVLDYPQLLSSEGMFLGDITALDRVIEFNQTIKKYINYIGGIHLWGKKLSGDRLVAHRGNLDTLFSNDVSKKGVFLESLHNAFNDDISRYMVLEVNSNTTDLFSIINDLQNHRFIFI